MLPERVAALEGYHVGQVRRWPGLSVTPPLRVWIRSDLDCLSQVSCGLNHTLVLSLDGMIVWAFGDGDYGKLGTGSSTAKYYPQVTDNMTVVYVPVEERNREAHHQLISP